jgi:hypothetical protein
MQDTLRIFVAGVITIGVVTALFLPGRSTVQAIGAAGNASSNLLGTAIKG